MHQRSVLLSLAIVAFLAASLSAPVAFAKKMSMDDQLSAATDVVQAFGAIPERAIPTALLKRAQAIVVIPDMVKFGFVVAGRHGKGVMSVRQGSSWSAPVFISMTGGSVGWQAGLQSSDVVLIFTNKAGVQDIANGKFTLGADASIAAGPLGRHGAAATDKTLSAEVYSYSRSRGLFAGVSLDGARLSIDKKANAAFYVTPKLGANTIVTGGVGPWPDSARQFVNHLPDANGVLGAGSAQPDAPVLPATTVQPAAEPVKTYAIGEREASGEIESGGEN
ncbi:MAG: lipid-binding SYLF domain-containing protein [Pseudomonadota bacterium]